MKLVFKYFFLDIYRKNKKLFLIIKIVFISLHKLKFFLLKFIYLVIYGPVYTKELVSILKKKGIKNNDVLFVQSSFAYLYNFYSSPVQLVNLLKNLVLRGSLFMPSYCLSKKEKVYDHLRSPTYTGIISETFRRSKGVVRSFHPRHSICGIGKHVKQILHNHEKCTYADGKNSPFDKLRYFHNSKILTLGLAPFKISFLHWLEDINPKHFPVSLHNSKPTLIKCNIKNKTINVKDFEIKKKYSLRLNESKIKNFVNKKCYIYFNYKGISIGIYNLKLLSRNLLQLRDNNIVHYDL